MLCDVCKKRTATYHSRSNINGKVSEVHLCEECLEQSHYNPLSIFSDELFSFESPMFRLFEGKTENQECTKCGTKFSQIINTSRVGCGDCYRQYKDSLIRVIDSLNYGDKHIGKTLDTIKTNPIEDKIQKLEKKLKQAVEKENYEEAAIIKKEIIALKEGTKDEK